MYYNTRMIPGGLYVWRGQTPGKIELITCFFTDRFICSTITCDDAAKLRVTARVTGYVSETLIGESMLTAER